MDGNEAVKYEIISLKRLQKQKINREMKMKEIKWKE
jgi:hypothetical protein